jgi:hypothetical protein
MPNSSLVLDLWEHRHKHGSTVYPMFRQDSRGPHKVHEITEKHPLLDFEPDEGDELDLIEMTIPVPAIRPPLTEREQSMLDAIRGLLSWCEYMGGYEAEEWQTARQIVEELS